MSVEVEPIDAAGGELESTEWDSDESDSEGAGQISKLALGIDASEIGNYDGKSAPINGSQYLLSVIREAKKAPQVVVANIKTIEDKQIENSSFSNNITEDNTDENRLDPIFLPTAEWQTITIGEFSELRSSIDCKRSLIETGRAKISYVQMPEKGNVVLWFKYCFGSRLLKSIANKSKKSNFSQSDLDLILECFLADLNNCPELLVEQEVIEENEDDEGEVQLKPEAATNGGFRPLMRIMLCLSQRLIEFLIGCHLSWLKKHGLFNVRQGEWIYALLACVQKPLEPSTVSDIRSICKSCISLRDQFCEIKKTTKLNAEGDSPECSFSLSETELEYLKTLNLFICLVSSYFGQRDLT